MSIFASIGARLAHGGARIRAMSWPSRLGVLGGGVVGELIVYGLHVEAFACAWLCWLVLDWGYKIECLRNAKGDKRS